MFSETTCLYTADRHWVRMDELAKYPVIPLMVWRDGSFRYTNKEYTVEVEENTRVMYRIKTIYQIDLLLTNNQKVPTKRGQVSAKQLLPDDEMHLYLDGKLLLTRPRDVIASGHRRSYMLKIKDGYAVIARDIDSRWQSAFDIGILVCDCYGSGHACTKVIQKFLPAARPRYQRKVWTPPQEPAIIGSEHVV